VQPQRGAKIPVIQLLMLGLAVTAIGVADMAGQPWGALGLTLLGLLLLRILGGFDEGARVRLLPHGTRDLGTVCGSGYAAMFALTASSMGLLIYGPAILQELRALSPLQAGYVVAAHAMAWTLAAFVVAGAGLAAEGRWIRFGAVCILAGVIALSVVMRAAGLAWVVLAAATMGAGFGFSSSLMNRRVLTALRDED